MFFRRKNSEVNAIDNWRKQISFRWTRIASHYDSEKHEYVYITEPVLQFRRDWDSCWQNVELNVEVMKPVAAPVAVNG